MFEPHKLTEGVYVRHRKSMWDDWDIGDTEHLKKIGKVIRVSGPRFKTDPSTGSPLDLVQVEWVHPTPSPSFKKTWGKARDLLAVDPLTALAAIAAESEPDLPQ